MKDLGSDELAANSKNKHCNLSRSSEGENPSLSTFYFEFLIVLGFGLTLLGLGYWAHKYPEDFFDLKGNKIINGCYKYCTKPDKMECCVD